MPDEALSTIWLRKVHATCRPSYCPLETATSRASQRGGSGGFTGAPVKPASGSGERAGVPGEVLDGLQRVVARVGAEPLRDLGRGRATQLRRRRRGRGRARARAGSRPRRRRRSRWCRRRRRRTPAPRSSRPAVTTSAPLGAPGDGDAAGAELERGRGTGRERGGAGEAQHLLVVGQEVVGVRQGVGDPGQHVRVARGEEVERGGRPDRPGVGEQLAGGLPTEELGPAEVEVGDAARADRSRSSRVKAPLAPMQCQAGRSPFGRTGITDEEVCWSASAHESADVDALASEHVAAGSSPSGSVADRAEAAHLGAEPAQHDRRAAGGAGRGEPDGLHQLSVGALRDRTRRRSRARRGRGRRPWRSTPGLSVMSVSVFTRVVP